MKPSLSSLAILIAAGALHACNADATDDDLPDGTDTGNPADGDGPNGGEGTAGGNCLEEESELDPDAETSLGFTAQSVLDLVIGEHPSSLAWLDTETEYGPESGRSEITLTITPAGAPLLVDRSPRPASSGNGQEEGPAIGLGELYSPCNDSIRLKVSIHVATAGGALDETLETTIEARAGDFASGFFSLDLEDINGSFEATPQVPSNFELTQAKLNFQLGFTEYGNVGEFSLQSEFRSADGSAAGVSAVGQGGAGRLAHFPADNYCGPAAVSVTADQNVRGLSMAQSLDALNAMSPGQVRYPSGAPSELTLAFTSGEERVCARFEDILYTDGSPGSMTLEFPGVVRLISTDSRIDGSVPLMITANLEQGRQETRAEANLNSDSAAGAVGLPAQFGIQDDIDFSAYDGGYVQFSTLVADDSVGGSLRVYGLDVADCVNNPPMIDPGSMSSPGCRGTDRIPLWGAFWGDWTELTQ